MYNSHSKYSRVNYVVIVDKHWFQVTKCECGAVHAYWVLEEEPSAEIPRLRAEDLDDEIRKHLANHVSLTNTELQGLVTIEG